MNAEGSLIDRFQRVHSNLRISVTDRCNIRCFYCMPHEEVRFKPRHEILTFEEIERFVRIVVPLGVNRLRVTGGEPLVRSHVPQLVRLLSAIPGVTDIAMTTNGILLEDYATDLKKAGLRRLNISLDGMTEGTFQQIARRGGLDRVLAGIAAAQRIGFDKIRLNAVSIRGITEQEVIPLGAFARGNGWNFVSSNSCPWMPNNSGIFSRCCQEPRSGPSWRGNLVRWCLPIDRIRASRRSITSLRMELGELALSIRSPSRSAVTAIDFASRRKGNCAIACSRRRNGTPAPCCAAGRAMMNWPTW